MSQPSAEFMHLMKHPVKFRMFLFSKLPSAFFAGVRLREIDGEKCVVTIPYKWFSQNPFRSTYFACLAMAAEMSTGALALAYVHKRNPSISMLVVKVDSSYFKKAIGITRFLCQDGLKLKDTIDQAISTGQPQSYTARSVGTNEKGELVAEFLVTWSFKAKK